MSRRWRTQATADAHPNADKGLETGSAVDQEVFIPKKEWFARKGAKRCWRCGQEGHEVAKGTNAKTAEPFVRGA